MKALQICLAVTLILALATNAQAGRVSAQVDQVQVSTRGEEATVETCLLFSLDTAFSATQSIGTATLTIPVGGESPAERTHFEIHPVLTDWATFSSRFGQGLSPSGDEYYRELYTRATFVPGRSSISVDLTGLLTEVTRGLTVTGFVVTAVGGGDSGLDEDGRSLLTRLAEASLDVSYRNVTPIPERGTPVGG